MTLPPQHRQLIDGPAGALEVLVEAPPQIAGPVCVICHPHPQYGGTLDNKVVYTLARAAQGLGAPAVRFNFRGVGRSEGAFANAVGEVDDLLAVTAFARARWPERPVHVAGFSFGAAVALRGHAAVGAESLLLVAPPAGMGYLEPAAAPEVPWQVIHGRDDQLIALDVLQRWLQTVDPLAPLSVIDDADHFFHGRLTPLREAAQAFWEPLWRAVP
ncbi:alpha/beta hydrolase [Immundisolibacter sp.]|uniref:alpha/beta hydrolase n=1 Tax=Immundisolibacter sp. TaxID=1934948 RepID=UPI003562CF82